MRATPLSYAAPDRQRQFEVLGGHIVQRAVRLQMRHLGAGVARHRLQCADLVGDHIFELARVHIDAPPSEPPQIVESRMRTDGDARGDGLGDHPLHGNRIAGVEPAGDARRADDLAEPRIVADVVRTKPLAHIGVEIDRFCHASSFEPCRTLPGESMKVRFLAAGDRALVVEFGDCIDRALSAEVLHLDASLGSSGLAGIVETVPTFRSLMVHYDPLATTRANLEQAISSRLDRDPGSRSTGTLWRVPVCYDGEFAPDLGEVVRLTGLSPGAVAALHSGT